MRSTRRSIWTAAAAAILAAGSFGAGMRVASSEPNHREQRLAQDLVALRDALESYRVDHGWYPADPERDYNDAGQADLLRRQLTEFTRDDGKPADRRDAQFCFGPYLREFPGDAWTGSRALIVDPGRSRALVRLRADIAAGNGGGGWYYEPRTGNIVPNLGRGRARLAGL